MPSTITYPNCTQCCPTGTGTGSGSCCGAGTGTGPNPGCSGTQSGIAGFNIECSSVTDCNTLIGGCVLFSCAACVNQYDFSDPDNDGDVGECPGPDGPGRPNCSKAAWYIVTSVDDCINCPNQEEPLEEMFCSVTGTFNCCYNGASAICSTGDCCGGPIGQVGTNPGCTTPTTFLYGPVYYGNCSTFNPADYAQLIGTCSAVACLSCPSGFAWYIVTGVVGCDDTTTPGYVYAVLSGTFNCCIP